MTRSCITIYTDASFYFKTKTGSWRAWIKNAPGETALHSGAFKEGGIQSSNEAELKAIANGLHMAKKTFSLQQKIIVVVTDSQIAIAYLNLVKNGIPKRKGRNGGVSSKPWCQTNLDIAKKIWAMVPEGSELRINKVKAHNGNKDGARSYINNLVDRAAKTKIREMRQQTSKEGNHAAR